MIMIDDHVPYLKMSRSDSLHLQIFGGISSQLQNLSREILEDSGAVDSGSGSHSRLVKISKLSFYIFMQISLPSTCKASALQMSVDSSNWKL